MDDNKNNSSFPDISGVFNVNDSDIPSRLLDKPEPRKRPAAPESGGVIFSEEPSKEEKLKKQQAVRRRGNAAKKRRLRRRRILTALAAVLLLIIVIFAIKTAVANSKRPQVELYTVTIGDVRETYSSSAAVVTASTSGSPITTYAIIPENSYDLYGLAAGQSAMITTASGKQYEAHVTSIAEESADTSLSATVNAALEDKTFSGASNIFVYVKPDAPMNEADGTAVTVEITTAETLDTVRVPSECIISDEKGDFVWTVGKFSKTLTKTYVTKSLTANGYTAIVGGLKKNELVVAKTVTDTAERPLIEGQKVKSVTSENGEETTVQ